MDAEEYANQTAQALNNHAAELDKMTDGVTKAAKDRTDVPHAKDIFKEITEAATECKQTMEYYGDDEPLPPAVRVAMERVQEHIANCTRAFVLYMAIARLVRDV
jgi:hypothetical protein